MAPCKTTPPACGHHSPFALPLPDVPLLDQDPRVMKRLRQTLLEHQRLQPPVQEVLRSKGEHIIQLVLVFVQQAVLVHPPHQRPALEDPLGFLFVEREQRTSGVADPGQGHLHAPQLALAAQPILAHEPQLIVESLFFEGPPWPLECLAICKAVKASLRQRRGEMRATHGKLSLNVNVA